MLTDIFARRYQDVPLWEDFDESARRLLVQGFLIVNKQLFPYNEQGYVRPGAEELWEELNKQLARELGLKDLSARKDFYAAVKVCENFVCEAYDGSVSADRFVKERLSFIEIAFRRRNEEIARLDASLDQEISESRLQVKTRPVWKGHDFAEEEKRLRDRNADINQAFRTCCNELNSRFREAGATLNYHNGLIQVSPDELTTDQIERPFWELVSDPKWGNVDHDMKEAIDRRDNAGRDPALYAAMALESAIKIISDEKSWTHGKETGAINYVENLGSEKNGKFIKKWERESLCHFFSNVRNPLGHGPGNAPMPNFTMPQTDWAIEFCMSWIKNLIRRM